MGLLKFRDLQFGCVKACEPGELRNCNWVRAGMDAVGLERAVRRFRVLGLGLWV